MFYPRKFHSVRDRELRLLYDRAADGAGDDGVSVDEGEVTGELDAPGAGLAAGLGDAALARVADGLGDGCGGTT